MKITNCLGALVVLVAALGWGNVAQADTMLIQYKLDEGSGASAADSLDGNHNGTFLSTPSWFTTDKPPISGNVAAVALSSDSNVLSTSDAADLVGFGISQLQPR